MPLLEEFTFIGRVPVDDMKSLSIVGESGKTEDSCPKEILSSSKGQAQVAPSDSHVENIFITCSFKIYSHASVY